MGSLSLTAQNDANTEVTAQATKAYIREMIQMEINRIHEEKTMVEEASTLRMSK